MNPPTQEEIEQEVRDMIARYKRRWGGPSLPTGTGVVEIDKDTQYIIKVLDQDFRDVYPEYWDLK